MQSLDCRILPGPGYRCLFETRLHEQLQTRDVRSCCPEGKLWVPHF